MSKRIAVSSVEGAQNTPSTRDGCGRSGHPHPDARFKATALIQTGEQSTVERIPGPHRVCCLDRLSSDFSELFMPSELDLCITFLNFSALGTQIRP